MDEACCSYVDALAKIGVTVVNPRARKPETKAPETNALQSKGSAVERPRCMRMSCVFRAQSINCLCRPGFECVGGYYRAPTGSGAVRLLHAAYTCIGSDVLRPTPTLPLPVSVYRMSVVNHFHLINTAEVRIYGIAGTMHSIYGV